MNPRNGKAIARALEQQRIDAAFDEIEAMTGAQLDDAIREAGGDPDAIGAAGVRTAREASERATKLAWHEARMEKLRGAAAEKLVQMPRVPRERMLARIKSAQRDSRMSAPVTAMFRKKALESSTDDELHALLVQIELLAELDKSS